MSCPLSNYEVFYSILCIFFVLKSSLSNISITILGFLSFWLISVINISSFQSFCHVQLFVTPWTAARWFPCPSPTPGVYSNSCPLRWWCHLTISSSIIPFSHLQSFPASGSFLMSQFFISGRQSIGVSASTSVLPVIIQDWFPLRVTGLISLQSKGLSRAFSNTTVQKHQFFGAQLSSQSNSHIHTWPQEKS